MKILRWGAFYGTAPAGQKPPIMRRLGQIPASMPGRVRNTSQNPGYPGEAADAEDRIDAALARLEGQMQRLAALQETLKETSARTQPRPRRIWDTLLRPAFGGGILAAVLGITAVTATIHASAAAMSVIGIILAAATAVTALFSLLVPWTSVRALNRRGDAHRALELVCGRDTVTTADSSDMVTASGESRTHGEESWRVENPGSGGGRSQHGPDFPRGRGPMAAIQWRRRSAPRWRATRAHSGFA